MRFIGLRDRDSSPTRVAGILSPQSRPAIKRIVVPELPHQRGLFDACNCAGSILTEKSSFLIFAPRDCRMFNVSSQSCPLKGVVMFAPS